MSDGLLRKRRVGGGVHGNRQVSGVSGRADGGVATRTGNKTAWTGVGKGKNGKRNSVPDIY